MKIQESKNKGRVVSSRSTTQIEKTVVEDDKNTWVFQDYMNKPNFSKNFMAIEKDLDHTHETDEEIKYFRNLQDTLFKKSKDDRHDDYEVKRIEHCCFYEILHKDLENPKKIEEDYSNNISNFGKKTFTDTMKVINNFIK